MAYTPVYLSATDDYDEVRVALGLAPDDTTSLPNSVIEMRGYLPRAETGMAAVLTDCEITFATTTTANQTAIKESVVYWVASLLAERWLARKQGSQVVSQSLGPLSVTYAAKQDWAAHGRSLRHQAGEAMYDVCADAVLAISGGFFAIIDEWADLDTADDDTEEDALA